MDLSKLKELKNKYASLQSMLPPGSIRPRFGKVHGFEKAETEAIYLNVDNWLDMMSRTLDPLRKVIKCIPPERWEHYRRLGQHKDLPEYKKRKQLESDFRKLWNGTMPEILKPSEKEKSND